MTEARRGSVGVVDGADTMVFGATRARLLSLQPGSRKFRVLVTRSDVPQEAIKLLRDQDYDVTVLQATSPEGWKTRLMENIADKDALLVFPQEKINRETLAPCLVSPPKVIATISAGYEAIDLSLCKELGIKVGNAGAALSDSVAELTVLLILMLTRRIQEAQQAIRMGVWQDPAVGNFRWMTGTGLKGKTVGIVGLGRIGLAVVERLRSFQPSFIYHNRRPRTDDDQIGARYEPKLKSLLAQSDIVIAACPLTPETRFLFDKDAFSSMKKTAYFINISRGGVVDQEDLVEALQKGTIAGAGLDVMTPEPLPPDHPLVNMLNVVLTPHISSAVWETRTYMGIVAAKNIIAALEGTDMVSQVC